MMIMCNDNIFFLQNQRNKLLCYKVFSFFTEKMVNTFLCFAIPIPILLIVLMVFSFEIGQVVSNRPDSVPNKWNLRCTTDRKNCFDVKMWPKEETASKPAKRFSIKKNSSEEGQCVMVSTKDGKAFGGQLGDGIFLEDFAFNNSCNCHNRNKNYKEVKSKQALANSSECDGCEGQENMAYQLEMPYDGGQNEGNCCLKVMGKPFNIELKGILEKLDLLENPKNGVIIENEMEDGIQNQSRKEPSVIFSAADVKFFPFLRNLIFTTKKTFGRDQKIIVYDLGGISQNTQMMEELAKVCNLELRKFNFSMLPKNVHSLRMFSWKILIIAEVLLTHPTLIYADTSIQFYSKEFVAAFLEAIDSGQISPYQLLTNAGHDIDYATHPSMFSYIPHYWSLLGKSVAMGQGGFSLVKKSEYTRKLLKWAVLCASTLECIDPPGSTINCPWPFTGKSKCHRQDQSLQAILTNNFEQEMLRKDPKFITHYDGRNPRNKFNNNYGIYRRTPLPNDVNFVDAVKCI